MRLAHDVGLHRSLALAIGLGGLVASACGSGFRADYEIPSPSGECVALLGCRARSWNHQLRILREGEVALDREIWFDRLESGIADARWKPDGSEFAVKVCGDGVGFVTIIDISTGRADTLQETEWSRVPAWAGFDDRCTFDRRLDAYEVRGRV